MEESAQLIGSKIGGYEVVDILGRGAMGVVLRARNGKQEVAIKLLAPDLAKDDVSIDRMHREASALSILDHPNIVTTYKFGILDNGQAYLIMEFVRGENLDDYLKIHGTLSISNLIIMSMQLAKAIQFAHDNGVVHRDIKPQNIMLKDVGGAVHSKILDFGIAKLADDSRRLTKPGEVVGSPIFMSPEQCQGKKTDQRTDIYSYGIVLFKCLAGVYPHHGANLRDTLMMKTTKNCPTIKEMNPNFDGPEKLEAIIHKCLEILPDNRYGTMDDVYNDLKALAEEMNLFGTGNTEMLGDPLSLAEASPVTQPSSTSAKYKKAKKIKSFDSSPRESSAIKIAVIVISLLVVCAIAVAVGLNFFQSKVVDVDPSSAETKIEKVDSGKVENKSKPNEKEPKGKPNSKQSKLKSKSEVPVKKKTASTTTDRAIARAKGNSVKSKEAPLSYSSKKKRGYNPTKDEQHDAWWKYRMKKPN